MQFTSEVKSWASTSGLPAATVDGTSGSGLNVVQTTGGILTPSLFPFVPAEEQEWQALLASERARAKKLGLTNKDVTAAIRERRHGR